MVALCVVKDELEARRVEEVLNRTFNVVSLVSKSKASTGDRRRLILYPNCRMLWRRMRSAASIWLLPATVLLR